MLIFSKDGQIVFDTTGSTIWIGPYGNHDDDPYIIYGRNCANMEPIKLAIVDSLQSAKNIIKVINVMTVLGIPTVDLDDDIDTIVSAYEENKDKIYFDKYLGSIISKILMR